MAIEYFRSDSRTTEKCKIYRKGECPLKKAIKKIRKTHPTSVDQASIILQKNGLEPKNPIYGVGLLQEQIEEAGRKVITADCPSGKCSILIRDSNRRQSNLGSGVIGTGWTADQLVKNNNKIKPQKVQV
jgi:hypothetical protein